MQSSKKPDAKVEKIRKFKAFENKDQCSVRRASHSVWAWQRKESEVVMKALGTGF
jgi:hypothetical protein